MAIITPANNLSVDPNFFDLSSDPNAPDDAELTPGLLAGIPEGLRALDGNDTITGSQDDEVVNGNQGDDSISGGSGSDYLRGGRDTDIVVGDEGNDILNGNKGMDIVSGGVGDDLVRGGRENDAVVGGEGNDTVIGDFGLDALAGDVGNDLFVLRADTLNSETEPNGDWIMDFGGFDNRGDADRIAVTGLPDGVTTADLIVSPVNLGFDDIAAVGFQSRQIIPFFEFAVQDVDPNGDQVVEAISIALPDGRAVGFATNATVDAVRAALISESDIGNVLAIG